MSRDWISLAVKLGTSLCPHCALGSSGGRGGSRGGGGRGRQVRSPPILPAKQVLGQAAQSDLTPMPMAAAAAAAAAPRECAGSRGSRAESECWEAGRALSPSCDGAQARASVPTLAGPHWVPPCALGAVRLAREAGHQPQVPVTAPVSPPGPARRLTPTSQHMGGSARVRVFPGTAVLPTTTSTSTWLSWGLSGCCLPRQTCI